MSSANSVYQNYAENEQGIGITIEKQAANQLGSNLLCGAGEEGVGEMGERGDYGSGFGDCSRFSLDFIKEQLARKLKKLL